MLIDEFLPRYDIVERHEVAVTAAPRLRLHFELERHGRVHPYG
jgi:hypothetical protein